MLGQESEEPFDAPRFLCPPRSDSVMISRSGNWSATTIRGMSGGAAGALDVLECSGNTGMDAFGGLRIDSACI